MFPIILIRSFWKLVCLLSVVKSKMAAPMWFEFCRFLCTFIEIIVHFTHKKNKFIILNIHSYLRNIDQGRCTWIHCVESAVRAHFLYHSHWNLPLFVTNLFIFVTSIENLGVHASIKVESPISSYLKCFTWNDSSLRLCFLDCQWSWMCQLSSSNPCIMIKISHGFGDLEPVFYLVNNRKRD